MDPHVSIYKNISRWNPGLCIIYSSIRRRVMGLLAGLWCNLGRTSFFGEAPQAKIVITSYLSYVESPARDCQPHLVNISEWTPYLLQAFIGKTPFIYIYIDISIWFYNNRKKKLLNCILYHESSRFIYLYLKINQFSNHSLIFIY